MTPPKRGVSLAPHTSLRVGGAADYFVLAQSAREVAEALAWARERALPVRVIGGGSNLLVADAGVEGDPQGAAPPAPPPVRCGGSGPPQAAQRQA